MVSFNTYERRRLEDAITDATHATCTEIEALATLAGEVCAGVDGIPCEGLNAAEVQERAMLVALAEDLDKRLTAIDPTPGEACVDEILRTLEDLGYLVIRRGP